MERAFGPKRPDHPGIGRPCPACTVSFVAGDYTTLVALGPGDDPEARARAVAGRAYNAVAVEVHFACVFGREPSELERPQPPEVHDEEACTSGPFCRCRCDPCKTH